MYIRRLRGCAAEAFDLTRIGADAGQFQPSRCRTAVDQGDRCQSSAGASERVVAWMRALSCMGRSDSWNRFRNSPSVPIRRSMWPHGQCRTELPVTIRPIRPEDEPLMVRFHETLSERSVYFRYFHAMQLTQRIAHDRLTRICFIDYEREMALVVLRNTAQTAESEILGVGRLIKMQGSRGRGVCHPRQRQLASSRIGSRTAEASRGYRARRKAGSNIRGHPAGKSRYAESLRQTRFPPINIRRRSVSSSGTEIAL